MRAEEEKADALTNLLVDAMAKNVPELDADARRACVEEFVGFFGRLVELFRSVQPSPAKAAAVMYFNNRLGLDRANETNAKIMLTLVETMNVIADATREAQATKKGRPS